MVEQTRCAAPARRPVYGYAQTRRMFDPSSIAIVGASPNPSSFGARTLANLKAFTGTVHLVNAKYTQIGDQPCHPRLSDIGVVPDCVFVAVPREAVLEIVEECVQLGVGGVVIFSSGFGESNDPQHRFLQERLVALTEGTGTRLLGPNCLGAMNAVTGMLATFATIPARMGIEGGRSVGLISQSGALGVGLSQAVERGVSFSHVLTIGNGCDVDVADEIAFLAGDPGCDVIACIFEGTQAPERLIEAGELARRANKAVVVFKLAVGTSGAEAALSHTGAIAGSAAGYAALFERAGFVVVDRFEDLLETACFFAKAPRASASGVAVLTPSGGAGIMAADEAERHGVFLPQPGPALTAELETHIPEFGAARNPCDVTAQILNDPKSFPACAEAFLRESDIAAIATPYSMAILRSAERNLELGRQARAHGKIACVYSLAGWLEGPGMMEMERSGDIALFRSASSCFRTLASWIDWSRTLRRAAADEACIVSAAELAAARAALEATGSGRTVSEGPAKKVLEACGVQMVGNRVVSSVSAAVDAARTLGFPVALKVDAPSLPHKTEAGVVRLNLTDEAAVRQAYDTVVANALKVTTADQIHGVLVQPMVPAGLEIMVGARVDPLFGPMVVAGFGGVFVELLKDTAVALAPVSTEQAVAMLRKLRAKALFDGFRGGPKVELQALGSVISRISHLISAQRQHIAEIDINPIICNGRDIVAVDGLIVKTDGDPA